jgi:hypothetical protein
VFFRFINASMNLLYNYKHDQLQAKLVLTEDPLPSVSLMIINMGNGKQTLDGAPEVG